MKNKHAQIWSLDLMAGMMLFLVGIMIFFTYTLNQPSEAQDNFEMLFYDGKIIADSLMSSGYPQQWNSTSAITIGITDENRINETKLKNLYDITTVDYTSTKRLFNTKYDYYFFFEENMTIDSNEVEGIGKPNANKDNINARNLIKITRFTVYQNKTTPLYLYLWEE